MKYFLTILPPIVASYLGIPSAIFLRQRFGIGRSPPDAMIRVSRAIPFDHSLSAAPGIVIIITVMSFNFCLHLPLLDPKMRSRKGG